MLGKTQRGGINKCPYKHPKVCYKYLNNGTSRTQPKGCLDPDNCNDFHPQMCEQSIKDRTCCYLKAGSRCRRGYHLRGTTYAEQGEENEGATKNGTNKMKKREDDRNNVETVKATNLEVSNQVVPPPF